MKLSEKILNQLDEKESKKKCPGFSKEHGYVGHEFEDVLGSKNKTIKKCKHCGSNYSMTDLKKELRQISLNGGRLLKINEGEQNESNRKDRKIFR